MITKIMGEAPFQVLTNNFSISPSNEGYTLQISADGKNYSNLFQVGANVTRLVTGVAANSYYRLLGNDSEVSINWMKTCVTEGGSGGSGTELQPITEFPMDPADGTVVAYNGSASASGVYQFDGTDWVPVGVDDLSAYYTSAQTEDAITSKNYVTSAQVETQVEAYNYITSADAETQILEKNYITSAYTGFTPIDDFNFISGRVQTNEQVVSEALNDLNDRIEEISGSTPTIDLSAYTPTSGFATINGSAITNGGNLVISAGTDMRGYWTSAQTTTWVNNQLNPIRSNVNDLRDDFDIMDEVVADALNDLNANLATKVGSESVTTIWKGTQQEYDAIVNPDSSTLYIIID